eukprot:CAMPEP_0119480436 /NCGR_PEP_ID=MMETSP1344-20130328/9243_1 /TAXON_ID=236787 /ORGANISM="Florenciella parvula, Strain CCMP2471" /LENGTH=125 /DNA_ID=CAMNT_0007514743 /DNA_START=36 /DNA_END=413 /DNA_ORIENTATION=+
MAATSMPMTGPVDQMRFGLQTPLAAHTKAPHPLQAALKKDEFSIKLDLVRRTYGSAAAMRLKSEKVAAEQIQRLPGLPSSFVALDTIMNEDNFISFEDTLGDPFEAPTEPNFKLHDVMEIKLGML